MSNLHTYTVLAIHPDTGQAYDVELIASSEHYAISRTRGTLTHRDRDIAWLSGSFTITAAIPFERTQS